MKSFSNLLTSPRPGTVPGAGGAIYTNRSVTVQGIAHQYQVAIPGNYVAGTPLPAIIGFPGSGSVGHDNIAQMNDVTGSYAIANLASLTSIFICPQRQDSLYRPNGGQQALCEAQDAAYAIIQDVASNWDLDRRRIYGYGGSAGMAEMCYFAALHPELFAAFAGGSGYPFAVVTKRWSWGASAVTNADAATLIGTRCKTVPMRLYKGLGDGTMTAADAGDACAAAFALVMDDFQYNTVTDFSPVTAPPTTDPHTGGYRQPVPAVLTWFATKVNPLPAW